MKKSNSILILIFFLSVIGLSVTSCKKVNSNSSTTSLTGSQSVQVLNSDAQDALADKTEEDVDSKLEELETDNYVLVGAKSYFSDPTDTVIITVDHPDTTFFPKVVTLKYYSFTDSSANESIVKNGTITVTISKNVANNSRLLSRSFVFDNFSVTTDSTTVIINGTRTVTRTRDALKLNGLQSAKISVTDHIIAATRWAVVTTGSTDTLKFTRNVDKVRTAISYFRNIHFMAGMPEYNMLHMYFRHIVSSDTITYTGTVTGINEKGDDYTKTITTPLIIVDYKGSLVISSGVISYQAGASTYEISFKEDPSHKHLTLVTVINNQTGMTKSFDRRFGRRFNRWW